MTENRSFLLDTYYLSKSISDKVNIFILDAARDNPFELRR